MTAVRNRLLSFRLDSAPMTSVAFFLFAWLFASAVSNYMVMFMRMLTSAQIRGNPEEYEPFVIHPDLGEKMGVKEFCEAVVEVLGREAGE